MMSTLQIADNMTSPLRGIVDALQIVTASMYDMQESTEKSFHPASLDALSEAIQGADASLLEMEEHLSAPPVPPPVKIPVVWESPSNPEIFTNSGVKRFRQELSGATAMAKQLHAAQARIAVQATNMDLFPPAAVADINRVHQRIGAIQKEILAIKQKPLDLGPEEASNRLERLRSQLTAMLGQQEDLNAAVKEMDLSGANAAFQRLNGTVGQTETYIRDSIRAQDKFGGAVDRTAQKAQSLDNVFLRMAQTLGVFDLVKQGVNMVVGSVDKAIARFDTLNNFPKVMGNMGFSAETAGQSLDRLSDGISGLPTALDDIVGSAQSIAILKKDLNLATDTALALNDAFYASGSSAEDASRGLTQYVQMLAKGEVDAQSWMSLQETMGYALDQTAQSFGFTENSVNQLYTALDEGEITFDQFNAKIIELDQALGGFAEVARTATGGVATAWQNLQTAVTRGVTEIVGAFDQTLLNAGLGGIEGVIDSLKTYISAFLGNVANFIINVGALLQPVISWLMGAFQKIGNWISENWTGIMLAAAVAVSVFAVKMLIAAGATLLANLPLILIIASALALIAVVVNVAEGVVEMGGTAGTVFGVISGGVNVVIEWFKNLGFAVANTALGIWAALKTMAANVKIAFSNIGNNIKSFFYGIASTVLSVIAAIAEKMNSLPYIEFDSDGIAAKADEYLQKSSDAAGSVGYYRSVSDAFEKGSNSFDAYQEGWVDDAYKAGAAWGDGIVEKIGDVFSVEDGLGNGMELPLIPAPEYPTPPGGDLNDFGGGGGLGGSDISAPITLPDIEEVSLGDDEDGYLAGIEKNTGNTAAALTDSSSQELRYLREIAERIALNNDTPLVVNVNMQNMQNRIGAKDTDIDGLLNKLTGQVSQAVLSGAKKAHV